MRESNVRTSTQLNKRSYIWLTISAILAAATTGFSIAMAPFAFNNPLFSALFEMPSIAALSGLAVGSVVMAVTLFSVLSRQSSFKGGASYTVGLLAITANLTMGNYLIGTLGLYSIPIIAALAVAGVVGIAYSSRQIKTPASAPVVQSQQQQTESKAQIRTNVIPSEARDLNNSLAASASSTASPLVSTNTDSKRQTFSAPNVPSVTATNSSTETNTTSSTLNSSVATPVNTNNASSSSASSSMDSASFTVSASTSSSGSSSISISNPNNSSILITQDTALQHNETSASNTLSSAPRISTQPVFTPAPIPTITVSNISFFSTTNSSTELKRPSTQTSTPLSSERKENKTIASSARREQKKKTNLDKIAKLIQEAWETDQNFGFPQDKRSTVRNIAKSLKGVKTNEILPLFKKEEYKINFIKSFIEPFKTSQNEQLKSLANELESLRQEKNKIAQKLSTPRTTLQQSTQTPASPKKTSTLSDDADAPPQGERGGKLTSSTTTQTQNVSTGLLTTTSNRNYSAVNKTNTSTVTTTPPHTSRLQTSTLTPSSADKKLAQNPRDIPAQLQAFGSIKLDSLEASSTAAQLIGEFCKINSAQEICNLIKTANQKGLGNNHIIFLLESKAWDEKHQQILKKDVKTLILKATLSGYAKTPQNDLSVPAKRIVENFFFTLPAETIAYYVNVAKLPKTHITQLLDKTSWEKHETLREKVREKIFGSTSQLTPQHTIPSAESKKLISSSPNSYSSSTTPLTTPPAIHVLKKSAQNLLTTNTDLLYAEIPDIVDNSQPEDINRQAQPSYQDPVKQQPKKIKVSPGVSTLSSYSPIQDFNHTSSLENAHERKKPSQDKKIHSPHIEKRLEEFSKTDVITINSHAYNTAARVVQHFLQKNLNADQIYSDLMSAAAKYNLKENHISLLMNNNLWGDKQTLRAGVEELILQSALNQFSRLSKDTKIHQGLFIVQRFFLKLSADAIAQHLATMSPDDQTVLLQPMFWGENNRILMGWAEIRLKNLPPTKHQRPPFPGLTLVDVSKQTEKALNGLNKILNRSNPESQSLVSNGTSSYSSSSDATPLSRINSGQETTSTHSDTREPETTRKRNKNKSTHTLTAPTIRTSEKSESQTSSPKISVTTQPSKNKNTKPDTDDQEKIFSRHISKNSNDTSDKKKIKSSEKQKLSSADKTEATSSYSIISKDEHEETPTYNAENKEIFATNKSSKKNKTMVVVDNTSSFKPKEKTKKNVDQTISTRLLRHSGMNYSGLPNDEDSSPPSTPRSFTPVNPVTSSTTSHVENQWTASTPQSAGFFNNWGRKFNTSRADKQGLLGSNAGNSYSNSPESADETPITYIDNEPTRLAIGKSQREENTENVFSSSESKGTSTKLNPYGTNYSGVSTDDEGILDNSSNTSSTKEGQKSNRSIAERLFRLGGSLDTLSDEDEDLNSLAENKNSSTRLNQVPSYTNYTHEDLNAFNLSNNNSIATSSEDNKKSFSSQFQNPKSNNRNQDETTKMALYKSPDYFKAENAIDRQSNIVTTTTNLGNKIVEVGGKAEENLLQGIGGSVGAPGVPGVGFVSKIVKQGLIHANNFIEEQDRIQKNAATNLLADLKANNSTHIQKHLKVLDQESIMTILKDGLWAGEINSAQAQSALAFCKNIPKIHKLQNQIQTIATNKDTMGDKLQDVKVKGSDNTIEAVVNHAKKSKLSNKNLADILIKAYYDKTITEYQLREICWKYCDLKSDPTVRAMQEKISSQSNTQEIRFYSIMELVYQPETQRPYSIPLPQSRRSSTPNSDISALESSVHSTHSDSAHYKKTETPSAIRKNGNKDGLGGTTSTVSFATKPPEVAPDTSLIDRFVPPASDVQGFYGDENQEDNDPEVNISSLVSINTQRSKMDNNQAHPQSSETSGLLNTSSLSLNSAPHDSDDETNIEKPTVEELFKSYKDHGDINKLSKELLWQLNQYTVMATLVDALWTDKINEDEAVRIFGDATARKMVRPKFIENIRTAAQTKKDIETIFANLKGKSYFDFQNFFKSKIKPALNDKTFVHVVKKAFNQKLITLENVHQMTLVYSGLSELANPNHWDSPYTQEQQRYRRFMELILNQNIKSILPNLIMVSLNLNLDSYTRPTPQTSGTATTRAQKKEQFRSTTTPKEEDDDLQSKTSPTFFGKLLRPTSLFNSSVTSYSSSQPSPSLLGTKTHSDIPAKDEAEVVVHDLFGGGGSGDVSPITTQIREEEDEPQNKKYIPGLKSMTDMLERLQDQNSVQEQETLGIEVPGEDTEGENEDENEYKLSSSLPISQGDKGSFFTLNLFGNHAPRRKTPTNTTTLITPKSDELYESIVREHKKKEKTEADIVLDKIRSKPNEMDSLTTELCRTKGVDASTLPGILINRIWNNQLSVNQALQISLKALIEKNYLKNYIPEKHSNFPDLHNAIAEKLYLEKLLNNIPNADDKNLALAEVANFFLRQRSTPETIAHALANALGKKITEAQVKQIALKCSGVTEEVEQASMKKPVEPKISQGIENYRYIMAWFKAVKKEHSKQSETSEPTNNYSYPS